TYTIALRNAGPITATASLVDPIPENTIYVPDSATGGATYNPSLNRIEWMGPVPTHRGYTWSDSDQPEGPIYEWVDIVGIGTPITGLGDDSITNPLPIGFPFPFYGNAFTAFRLCSNGFLSFTSTSTTYSNVLLPSGAEPFNLIAPFWDDLTFLLGGEAYYWTNNQDTLVVSYINVPRFGDEGPYTFQVILRADGSIIFQYQTMGEPTDSATIGIQNADGTQGLTIAHDQAYVHDELAVLISPPSPPPAITFQVRIADPLPAGTVITNTATLDDGQGHILQASATTTVLGPDLTGSTKTVDKAMALAGDVLTYTIALRNAGPITATASLVDPIPANTTYVPDSATGGAT
ncbi:TPA: DUF11 domain-containing protein, partial [Candidatus Bipolaricaulota bacterium]|nr:DUF11 domain-containing protein [Candidatus Bipolaricaulota bacterium]